MFSIVATETSVLTFISIPGLAYRQDWFFLQLALGYIVGRIFVAIFLLPKYFKGNINSIYEILGSRFSPFIQKCASAIFLITRIFADGVRFLATAVIIESITGWPIWFAVVVIGIVTMIYTLSGGIRAVVWVDSFQFILYLFGGILVLFFIYYSNSFTNIQEIIDAGKLQIFRFNTNGIAFDSWYFLNAFLGGALLSFASHGVDYMMVQRVLTCGDLNSARKAMIGSGFFVFMQFSIFLLVGSFIWIFNGGVDVEKDRELSNFIVNHLPIGIRGVLLAGVLSAAMSTLSSSINSLASSTLHDWFKGKITISNSILVSAIWALILISIALLFDEGDTAIVILGLKIASFTYGSLLALFVLSFLKIKFSNIQLLFGLLSGIAAVFFFQYMHFTWTWFIGISVLVNILTVLILNQITNLKYLAITLFSSFILFIFFLKDNKYYSGLDKLEQNQFINLKDKNIGLVLNHTSVNQNGEHLIDIAINNNLKIKAIFTPEHGLKGLVEAGQKIADNKQNNLEIPIFSLYGKNKKPKPEMLDGINLLIFDIQDIGVRYYTYISTMGMIMEAASEIGIPLMILDRVNPLGKEVDGPILKTKYSSFVGMYPIPIRHGMSIGELANMIIGEKWLVSKKFLDLKIVKYSGKPTSGDAQKAFNISPSPNMLNLNTAWIYQGTCLLEGTNLSEGRATDAPFLKFGAPWINNKLLFEKLDEIKSANDDFEIVEFTPKSSYASKYPKYENRKCYGLNIKRLENPIKWVLKVLEIIKLNHPEDLKFLDTNFIDKLYGSNILREIIEQGASVDTLITNYTNYKKVFLDKRKKYMIY